MSKIPVALQLWSVRHEIARDFAGTVAAVAQIGYRGVELAGYGNLDAAGAKAALAAAGLSVAGMHVPIEALQSNLYKAVNEALLLGTRHVTCPFWNQTQFATAAAVQKVGEQLDAIGSVFHANGIQFSYHNHAQELKVVEGRTIFDWILASSQPRHLAAEPDVYWLHVGGVPPAKFLRNHGARVPLIHLKDDTEIGKGPVDFAAVFEAVDDVGATEWLIVEQEKFTATPLEGVRACFEQVKAWGRA